MFFVLIRRVMCDPMLFLERSGARACHRQRALLTTEICHLLTQFDADVILQIRHARSSTGDTLPVPSDDEEL